MMAQPHPRPVNRAESDADRLLAGSSAAMQVLRDMVADAARTRAPVLVVGETGTGKSLVVRCIHDASVGSGAPLVTVVCPSVGHEPTDFPALFAQAAGGTLLLDEVADLSLGDQAAFLAADGTLPSRVQVRLAATTHLDLAALARAGRFRQDLYRRLATVCIDLPPLRQRLVDLPALAAGFLDQAATRGPMSPRPRPRLLPEALVALAAHAWPGNVRELENVLQRVLISSGDDKIGGDEVRAALKGWVPPTRQV